MVKYFLSLCCFMKYLILMLLISIPFVLAERTAERTITRITPLLNVSVPLTVAVRPVCQSGVSRCEDNTFQLCKAGMWLRAQTCTKSQICSKKGCVSINSKLTVTPVKLLAGEIVCPVVKTFAKKPLKAPFDLKKGDCALKGKPITAYLGSLQKRADECKALIIPNWNQVVQSKTYLHQKIDALPTVSPTSKITASASCFKLTDEQNTPFEVGESVPADAYYANWLLKLGKSVQSYCDSVTGLIQPVANKCSEYKMAIKCIIDDREGVSEGERESFHMGIDSASNAAKIRYDSLGFVHAKTITENIANFKKSFNEKNVCTTKNDSANGFGKEEE